MFRMIPSNLGWHPALAETRKTPEFPQLVVDLGFPDAREAGNDWGDHCSKDATGKVTCH